MNVRIAADNQNQPTTVFLTICTREKNEEFLRPLLSIDYFLFHDSQRWIIIVRQRTQPPSFPATRPVVAWDF
jgi:hypothetical protein